MSLAWSGVLSSSPSLFPVCLSNSLYVYLVLVLCLSLSSSLNFMPLPLSPSKLVALDLSSMYTCMSAAGLECVCLCVCPDLCMSGHVIYTCIYISNASCQRVVHLPGSFHLCEILSLSPVQLSQSWRWSLWFIPLCLGAEHNLIWGLDFLQTGRAQIPLSHSCPVFLSFAATWFCNSVPELVLCSWLELLSRTPASGLSPRAWF